jgi:hypothetical protein
MEKITVPANNDAIAWNPKTEKSLKAWALNR